MPSIGGYYDPKKKTIVKYGQNRPCGKNHYKSSIHAEECAIKFCQKNDKRNRFIIIISKFNKDGFHIPKMSCRFCCKLANRLHYQDRIFTIENQSLISAIPINPEYPLSYKIKHAL